jgi:hypothetical protein
MKFTEHTVYLIIMKITRLFLILFFCFFLITCEDDHIKQVRIELCGPAGTASTNSTEGTLMNNKILYKDFNKRNYPGLQSIVFTACLHSERSTTDCIVKLFNLTDSISIEGSTLSAGSVSGTWVETGNLADALPLHPIDLTVLIRSEYPNISVSMSAAYLYIDMN